MLEKYILTDNQVDRISQFGVDSIMLCCYLDVLENVINSGEDAEFLQALKSGYYLKMKMKMKKI